MAENQSTTLSRRSFLVAGGVAAAGVAVAAPVVQNAFPAGAPAGRGPMNAAETYRAAWRAAYFQELEQFAETLKPGFAAGEFYSFRDDSIPGVSFGGGDGQYALEEACVRHFGLRVEETIHEDGDASYEGDSGTAHAILSASPHADSTGEGAVHPCDHAKEAVAWDVIAIARERGWYTPTPDESKDPVA